MIFTVASLLCGVATSPLFLDLARALQGVGGAAMFATSLALIGQEFRGPERGTAIALWGVSIGDKLHASGRWPNYRGRRASR